MSGLSDLEEIAEQNDIRVNSATEPQKGWAIGPKHGSPARERVEAQKPPAKPAEPTPAAQSQTTPIADELIATVRRHQDIVEVFRTMKGRLGLTNEFIDNAGGLTKGHTDKMLGPSETKSWGPTTFDLFCEIFAIEFRVCVDMAAVKRMEAVWEGRKRAVELSDNSRISVKLIEKAKPHVIKHLAVAGGKASGAKRTGSHGSEIMRKVAQKGWRTRRRNRRLKAAQPASGATA